ncbi:disease resistance protein RGA5-like [Triticum dicoccoides]|uniref:disease resistance protein RGA5-like n=1 Tax=Triticum dicoccoides TaxID=85692 RepID=UPI00189179FB|nr:disease resistance protein RGA5-like [Triticum dicoccoides]
MSEIVNNLLAKLTDLLGDECQKLKGVEHHVRFLEEELSTMKAFLEELGLRDELDPLTKDWRDHVRDMAYDMEDCLDDFLLNLGSASENAGFIERTTQLVKTLWARHQFTSQIQELKDRAIEANHRRKRYKLDDSSSSSSTLVLVDPRVSALYREAASLVGIDGPREELVSWLADREEKLKVVSVVGFGGLGKTTLAKQVYDKIGEQFNCKAFVSVSQRPDMAALLIGLQSKLGGNTCGTHEVQDIVSELQEYLRDKRYLFIYLGMHPEVHEIMRDDLVRQWIAESIVRGLPGQDLEDVGRSYFNELINRSLIQPHWTVAGDVLSCRVHDMIRDVIISKCEEENFMSVVYSFEDMERLHKSKLKVRRLFLSSSSNYATDGAISRTTAASLSKVRSIVSFGESKCLLPRYLRVLFVENSRITVDLSDINRLFHLRYLKVTARDIKLPSELKRLVHLETLELDGGSIPSDVVQLPRLFHLTAWGHRLPEGIENLKLLRTLKGFELTHCSWEDIEGLGKLSNLRELCIIIKNEIIDDDLVSSIEKLRNLRHLRFRVPEFVDSDSLLSLSNAPLYIETLRMCDIVTFRIPRWIGDLHYLRRLELAVRETSTDDIRLLGELRSLVELDFTLLNFAANGVIIILTGLFPALEYFESKLYEEPDYQLNSAEDDVMAHLHFEVGAMPKLQRLELHSWEVHWGGTTPVGMEDLLALQQIVVSFVYSSDVNEVKRRAESAFRDSLQAHPNRPSVRIF